MSQQQQQQQQSPAQTPPQGHSLARNRRAASRVRFAWQSLTRSQILQQFILRRDLTAIDEVLFLRSGPGAVAVAVQSNSLLRHAVLGSPEVPANVDIHTLEQDQLSLQPVNLFLMDALPQQEEEPVIHYMTGKGSPFVNNS